MKKDLRMYEISKVNLKKLGESLDIIAELADVFIDSNNLYTERDEYDRIIKIELNAQENNDSMIAEFKYNDADNEIVITKITSDIRISTHVIAEPNECSNFNSHSTENEENIEKMLELLKDGIVFFPAVYE